MSKNALRLRRALRLVLAFSIGAAAIALLAWTSGLIPTYVKNCYEYAGHEKCPTYHIALFTLVKIGEVLNWASPAITAAATGLIAYFTLTLKRSTDNLWDVTRRSADIAERALTELERPFITVEVLQSGLTFTASGTVTSPISDFKYQFVNHGRTPAQLIELVESWPVVDRIRHPTNSNKFQSVQPPPIDPKTQRGRQLPFGVVVSQNKPFELSANAVAVIDIQHVNVRPFFHSLGSDLYFCGYVRYQDIFDKRYIFGFCAVYDFIGRRFVLMGDSRYNYTRREDGPEQESPLRTLGPST